MVLVESSWNVMAHSDGREGKWRWNWRMEWVASTLHTTSEHGVSSITTADVHTSAASSRLNWRPCRFKWTRLFRRKTKSGFCVCPSHFKRSLSLTATVRSWCSLCGPWNKRNVYDKITSFISQPRRLNTWLGTVTFHNDTSVIRNMSIFNISKRENQNLFCLI